MTDPYIALAKYYDSFTGNVDYGRRADFLVQKLSAAGKGITVLDAGCGSGELSRRLAEAGLDVIGVDISESMLAEAREKNPEQLLLCQDLRELDLYGTVRGVVCMQDTLNHMGCLEDVDDVLGRFSLFCEQGSIVIFDINSEYKHREVLADNCFIYEDEEAFFAWQNSYDELDGSVTMYMDLFEKDGKTYRRYSTELTEILIGDEEMEAMLGKHGLFLKDKLDGDNYGPLTAESERIVYVTEKR